MTDADLREARTSIDERIVGKRRHGRRVAVAAVAAALVLVAGVVTALLTVGDDNSSAVQPAGRHPVVDPDGAWLTGDAPTPQRIQGVWGLKDADVSLQFGAGGLVRFTQHGSLFDKPDATGTYSIKGELITMKFTRHDVAGCVNSTFGMLATVAHDATMNFVPQTPADPACAPVPAPSARGTWEQTLPTPPRLAGVTWAKDRQFEPLTDLYNMYGVLMPQGGGHLVEIEPGAYYVADATGAVVDRGRWALRRGDLTLTSAGGSECAKGDRFVLAGVENETPGLNGIRGTVMRDDCAGGWAAPAFFTITHRSFN